jgi:hypothetical protein
MQLRYVKTVREAGEGAADADLLAKVVDLSWSPNSTRLAVATNDRQIVVFDESGSQRDRFSLKPANKVVRPGRIPMPYGVNSGLGRSARFPGPRH